MIKLESRLLNEVLRGNTSWRVWKFLFQRGIPPLILVNDRNLCPEGYFQVILGMEGQMLALRENLPGGRPSRYHICRKVQQLRRALRSEEFEELSRIEDE